MEDKADEAEDKTTFSCFTQNTKHSATPLTEPIPVHYKKVSRTGLNPMQSEQVHWNWTTVRVSVSDSANKEQFQTTFSLSSADKTCLVWECRLHSEKTHCCFAYYEVSTCWMCSTSNSSAPLFLLSALLISYYHYVLTVLWSICCCHPGLFCLSSEKRVWGGNTTNKYKHKIK